MDSLQQWFEIAKYVGAGATFILGIGTWALWYAYQGELKYSRERDRETLTVLNSIINSDKDNLGIIRADHQQIIASISDLKTMIQAHMSK